MNKARNITTLRILQLVVLIAAGLTAVLVFRQSSPGGLGLLFALLFFFCAIVLAESWLLSRQMPEREGKSENMKGFLDSLNNSLSSTLQEALRHAAAEYARSAQKISSQTESSIQALSAKLEENMQTLEVREEKLFKMLSTNAEPQRLNVDALVVKLESLSSSLAEDIKSATGTNQRVFETLANQLGESAKRLDRAVDALEESTNLIHVNQAGLQSGIEMLNSGLEQILEKLQTSDRKSEDETAFIERLHQTLEGYHEKATEVLIDTAHKAREILVKE